MQDDLIVIAGVGGFIGGFLAKYFRTIGYQCIRGVDKKPITNWYQHVPDISLPITEAVASREVTLPRYPSIQDEDVDDVRQAASNIFGVSQNSSLSFAQTK